VIRQLLDDVFEDVIVEMLQNTDDLLKLREWTMVIPKYNFSLFDLLIQPSLTGENDRTEVLFMNSISNGYAALFNILFALDLDFNPMLLEQFQIDTSGLYTINIGNFGAKDRDAIVQIVFDIKTLIDRILLDPVYARFLKVNGEQGTVRIQEAAGNIGMTFGELAQMIDSIQKETDEQNDDVIRYVDLNGNIIWDPDELLLFPGIGQMDKELVDALAQVLLALKINFVDGVPFALNNFNDLLCYFDLCFLGTVLDTLYLMDAGEIDLAEALRDPDDAGLRPLLQNVSDFLGKVIDAMEGLEFE
jgi:hypothetical protein